MNNRKEREEEEKERKKKGLSDFQRFVSLSFEPTSSNLTFTSHNPRLPPHTEPSNTRAPRLPEDRARTVMSPIDRASRTRQNRNRRYRRPSPSRTPLSSTTTTKPTAKDTTPIPKQGAKTDRDPPGRRSERGEPFTNVTVGGTGVEAWDLGVEGLHVRHGLFSAKRERCLGDGGCQVCGRSATESVRDALRLCKKNKIKDKLGVTKKKEHGDEPFEDRYGLRRHTFRHPHRWNNDIHRASVR